MVVGLAAAVAAAHLAALDELELVAVSFTLLTGTVILVRYAITRDLLDPLILFMGALCFAFGIHSVWRYHTPPTPLFPAPVVPYEQGLVGSTLVLAAGSLVLLAAFSFARFRPRVPGFLRAQAFPTRALWVVFTIGFAANLYGIHIGLYQKNDLDPNRSTTNLLLIRTLGDLAILAATITVLQYHRFRDRANRNSASFQIVLLALFALSIGHRLAIVSAGFAWLAARHYGGDRRLRPAVALLIVGVFLFVITPIVQSGRDHAALNGLPGSAGAELTIRTLPARVQGLAAEPSQFLQGFNAINRRTALPESLAIAYDQSPRVTGFQYGASFVDIPLSLVPRQFFPSKVSHDRTLEFAVAYTGVVNNGVNGTAVALSIPGDLYVNFGVVGVLVGFLVIGLGLRWVANHVRETDPLVFVPLYVLLMLKITLVEVTVSTMTTTVMYAVGTYLAGMVLLRSLTARLVA